MRQQFKSVKLWPQTHEVLRALSDLTGHSIAWLVDDMAWRTQEHEERAVAARKARRAKR